MTSREQANQAMLDMVREAAQRDLDANIDGRMFFAADTAKFYAYIEAWEALVRDATEREAAR